jgi:serine/threonine-protein kinase
MGRVYRAFQAGIDRDVAVKILHRELSGNAELVGRFHREAKVASRLVHPNVVQVLMSGSIPRETDTRVGGELYLVMEHLDGISLLSALAAAGTAGEGNALPLPRALHILLQVCDAVGEAHAQGIVHRDLKPENIMLVRRGEDPDFVKVLDFGIARLDWADKSSVSTQAGLIFGTAKYISPEGAEGQPVGPPADVYSIATMLYQCLAGRAPFEGDSPVALLVQHTHAPPPDLRSIARASYVPVPIAQVVMQNLAKRPGERARDARALGRDLALAARESGLDPDEIATHPGMQRGAAVVKLASKARTRALELGPELAARIGAASAQPSAPDLTPIPASARGPRADAAEPPGSWRQPAGPASSPGAGASWERGAAAQPEEEPPARVSRPSLHDVPPARASRPSLPDATLDRGGDPLPLRDDALGVPSTMQGIASEARPRPRRARIARTAAILACAAATLLVAVLGDRHLGTFGGAAGGDSVEAQIERARDCMRRHAWDAPPGENVRELAERARARWPSDARVADLHREAAERLVADALGRKYAGDDAGAIRLTRLALELQPAFTTAQHLAADLEAIPTPAGEVLPQAPLPEAGPGSERPPGRWPLPAVGTGVPGRAGGDPRRGAATSSPTAAPTAVPSASSAPAAAPGPVLPPSPPPLPAEQGPAPAPAGTGPWL